MLRMKSQEFPNDPMEDVDLVALGAGNFQLSIGYSHAAYLRFSINAPQHSTPIPRLAFIQFWDDTGYLPDGTQQTDLHPLFEGYVESIEPSADSRQVNYTAYDPTYRASKEITVFSLPWDSDTAPNDAAVPVLVVNVKNDSDDDYSFQRQSYGNASIGNIISLILDDQNLPLKAICAAPASGAAAYELADISGLGFAPQEKLVFRSESVRDAVQRLERYEPRCRMLFRPGFSAGRKWRFPNLTNSPQVTLELNELKPAPGVTQYRVDSLELIPVLENCFGAVKLYGPPQPATQTFYWFNPNNTANTFPPNWAGNTLAAQNQTVLETVNGTNIFSWFQWQIINPDYRPGAATLPDWTTIEIGSTVTNKITIGVKQPSFLLSWDGGANWFAAQGVWFDRLNGRAVFNGGAPWCLRTDDRNQGTGLTGQTYFPPNAVKLVWAPYIEPLSVRVPATGFEGTLYTLTGRAVTRHVDEPSLAVGYEYGFAVTTQTRRDEIAKLGRSLLDFHKDICWAGGAQIRGIDYSFCHLDRRINFHVNDGSGGTVSAGWDQINCFLTDVTYDWESLTTTLTFSSNKLELCGEDPEKLKQRLGIRALNQNVSTTMTNLFQKDQNWKGESFNWLAGVKFDTTIVYTDPQTGAVSK